MLPAGITRNSDRKNERGSVLAYTVISALFLFFAVGLGVDLSHLYLAKAELQNGADAAALAGASALTNPEPDRIEQAVDRALAVLNQNRYNFDNRTYAAVTPVANQRALVEFAVNLNDDPYLNEAQATAAPANIRFVRVRTPSVPISIFFAVPILGGSRNLDARATAGLSVPGSVNPCPMPLAVLDCGTDPQCLVDGVPAHMNGVCNTGGPKPNPDGTACNPDKQFCRNCVYTIRAGASTGGPGPGNFHGLCCPGQECDADWIRRRLAGGNDCIECPPVNAGEEITPTTKPGINEGPIRQGINTRFDEYNGGDPPLNPTEHPPDPNIASDGDDGITYQEYLDGDPFEAPTHTPQDGRRLLVFPITPFSSWTDTNGRDTVSVSSLGAFFIQKKIKPGTSGEIKAEYVGPNVVSVVGGGGGAVTNLVTPVLYR